MIRFLSRRLAYMALTLLLVSLVSFVIIQAAPGDYAEIFAAQKAATGAIITLADIEAMRIELGLDQPWYVQYGRWLAGALHGDFGYSWAWRRPVGEVIAERMPLTLTIAFATLIFMYAVSIPVGIYSAVRRYSFGDYAFSIAGYLGLAIPNFLLALVLLYISQQYFHQSVGGLFSPGYENAAWSWAKVQDLLAHLIVPVVVLGTSGTAFLTRAMRAAVLDELNKMYVLSARASGLSPMQLLLRYPVRMALNPIASTLGWRLTYVISGAPIVGYVLALPDTGPLFLNALLNQDMLLAGALIFIFCALTIIGTFVSDLLLVLLDPRIRLE
ncbi:MAG: ABC transporter permease [Devosia nanyangense]|uniref:ABC transporter permease n=1 Tax=Devosia nanyangense TaxID=1228055 RepID=A0A933KZ78_9HYPH|nr:ABC transporter permease [Devosia nanyangense]